MTALNQNTDEACHGLDEFDLGLGSSDPIQILVFPPKNKKFRVDEKTSSIQIEPMESHSAVEKGGMTEACTDVSKECIPHENNEEEELTERKQNVSEEIQGLNVLANKSIKIQELLKIEKPFSGKNCFLKGCRWSPDGFCLLSNSEDNVLRLFEIPEGTTGCDDILPVLIAKEGGTVYDYEWYPKMRSDDPITCVFASTSQSSPIHLWDAYTGSLRATYQPIDQYDEVTAAYSLAFSPDGSKIYSGFKKLLRIFDISLPGRVSEERNLKPKGDIVFQTNIISCIAINPVVPDIYALGSYDRTIGIYTEPKGEMQCLLKGHKGGLTQILFSRDGFRLYSGGRKDPEIICWDLRNPGKILFILNREVNTNQRIYFDLSSIGSYLITGSTDGKIKIYDTESAVVSFSNVVPEMEWLAHSDCVNGVNFHPTKAKFASSSGQYHIPYTVRVVEEEDDKINNQRQIENSLKIWSISTEDQCES